MQTLKVYRVDVDAETGEWRKDTLRLVAEAFDAETWFTLKDSATEHFDTADIDGELCAVICNLVRD